MKMEMRTPIVIPLEKFKGKPYKQKTDYLSGLKDKADGLYKIRKIKTIKKAERNIQEMWDPTKWP